MKRGLAILVILMIILIVGGALTANLGFSLPTLVQTTAPDASVFKASNTQATNFLLLIGFFLVNVIGAGLTLAAIFWFLSKQVKIAKEMPTLEERRQQDLDALPEKA